MSPELLGFTPPVLAVYGTQTDFFRINSYPILEYFLRGRQQGVNANKNLYLVCDLKFAEGMDRHCCILPYGVVFGYREGQDTEQY